MQQSSQIRRLIFAVVVMYKFYLNILLLFCCAGSIAQPVNLVPNGSFEDTIDFGNGAVEPRLWDLTLGTPNYFSSYFKYPFENALTPQNYYGYQQPKDGESYVGLFLINISDSNKREYIQVKLNYKLEKDSLYNLTFWVNMPDSFHLACKEKNIAFAFSDIMIEYPQHLHTRIDYLSPVYNSESTWNTANKLGWEKITKVFAAKGYEEYLIIGNFLSDTLTELIDIGGGEKKVYKINSYYFIDDIELYKYSEIDTNEIHQTKKLIIPNVFTPNSDGINDKWIIGNDSRIQNVIIYNRWGEKIREWNFPGNSWDGDDYSSGLYYYKVVYMDKGVQKVETGSVTLMR